MPFKPPEPIQVVVNLPPSRCSSQEFECQDKGTCLPLYLHCDGEANCWDLSDEVGCDEAEVPALGACQRGHFQCVRDGSCIPIWQKCDGVFNCRFV